jgi:xanthine dehydrogenase/oxidase
MGNCFEGAAKPSTLALPAAAPTSAPTVTSKDSLSFYLNGKYIELGPNEFDPRMTLLEYIRDVAQLKGTKRSCCQGGCGACVVYTERYDWARREWLSRPLNSCLKPLASMDGLALTTVEGIGSERKGLHPVQERIACNHSMQCGFCTPGFVMSAYAMLKEHGQPNQEQVMQYFDGNICRCTGYRNLVNASSSFAKDASPGVTTIFEKCKPCDGNKEKAVHLPPPQSRLQSKTFSKGNFTWIAPSTLSELVAAKKSNPRAPFILGDTAKGIRSAAYEVFDGKADTVIYYGNVEELSVIKEEAGCLIIGSALRIQQIVDALEERQNKLPFAKDLGGALYNIAQRHLRSEAGWAGNLMITKTGFPSDLYPAMLAADASLSFVVDGEEKTEKLEELKAGGKIPPNALLTKLIIPLNQEGEFRYYRTAQRKWLAHSFVNMACRAKVDVVEEKFTSVTVVVGNFSSRGPVRCPEVERAMLGKKLDSATLQAAIAAFHSSMDKEFASEGQYITNENPIGKDDYRKSMPDAYLTKFFMEVQNAYGLKHWKPSELGTMKPPPLNAPKLEYQEHPGRESIPQLSAKSLATGETKYADDQKIPALCGYMVLTEAASGKVTKIDVSKAEQADGVVTVVTAKDIPGANNAGFVPGEEFLFVPEGENIMTTGQQVALVVAKTYRQAKKAAALVEVEYSDKNKDAVTSIKAAREKKNFLDEAATTIKHEEGNPEQAIQGSEMQVSGKTRVIGQHGFPMEKQATLAVPEERGGMTLYCSTQGADFCRMVVSGIMGMTGSKLIVRQTRAGGGFGVKLSRNIPVAGAAAVAAGKVEQPVRVAYDAYQEQAAVGGRHGFEVEYKIGFNKDGVINGAKVELWGNAGCTHDFSGFLFLEVAEAIPSVYNWGGNLQIDIWGMKTNLPTNTAVRSFGNPQAMFVTETMLEHVASALGKPVEAIREANMLSGPDPVCPWGQKMEGYISDKLYTKVKDKADFKAREAAIVEFNSVNTWRKRGISAVPIVYGHAYVYASGTSALVNVTQDGCVTVHHGCCEIGQGIHTKVAQCVALTLGCPLDVIRVGDTNTEIVPNQKFTGGSIASEVACDAAIKACEILNKKLDIHRKALSDKNGKDPAWGEVCAAANSILGHQGLLSATAISDPCKTKYKVDDQGKPAEGNSPYHGDYFTYGAGVSEVEVDVLTGEIQILRSDLLYDVGKSLSPGIDIGQVEGSFSWGIGYYMYEEPLFHQDGKEKSQGVWAYKPPMAAEMPTQLNVELLKEGNWDKGILGSKAVGEPPFMLSYSVVSATKKAIDAARKDAGLTGPVDLPMPCSVDAVKRAIGLQADRLKC